MMNPPIETNEQRHLAAQPEPIVTDLERLAECGFSAAESAALPWLRHWYHMGGSDRVELVRHWAFLKWLVVSGRLDV
jgi:hypothetical protein